MSLLDTLAPLRAHGKIRTSGLDDATIERFAQSHPQLAEAVSAAAAEYAEIKAGFPELLDLDEPAQAAQIQTGFVNFYSADTVNPYVALAARGPWVVTLKGAVLHDSGGYGMLGFGHTPQAVLEAMAKPQVMANIMTPNIAQLKFDRAMRKEIGQTGDGCPYAHFMCLNSGSESVSLASRIVDANAKTLTDPGARHAGKTIKRLVVKGAFHGRTERPALYSDSSRKTYVQHLASFRGEDSVITVPPYDAQALRRVFADAEANGWFIEAMFLEPVMGEGDPGRGVPRAFYDLARELTAAHGALLLVDSIQAGLRATGYLSIVDYPGFEGIVAPDMETYSKALNAGQYPLSVLAVTGHAGHLYKRGLYGNTMTANPRALDVACTVLGQLTPALRANIRDRGAEALRKLEALKAELNGLITKVQGTGLLFSCELAPGFKGYGAGSTEEWMREQGIGVIHGGENSLRFTPHFAYDEAELDLLVAMIKRALLEGPRVAQTA
ncbi:aminotransferase class III-fold pyridoxal phosphate-dependent enzyme [Lysobacter pythonis]|uniref:Aminotransferase class III-fold pyridoxal phosphate-dependent enzyme n=1 Tax=Solilutibacter pythonis TaxID=2483112 RepID=A0A3M2I114_9GAMM|nr:aminotransferase class III-fold pyridoxal phosphate-dependent enzyme [Lysobacter pythonis]RMH93630.1 aminotransferase class III-fold pyridoxal phosphate-dependent enzyme [Lysobacter pythonis]